MPIVFVKHQRALRVACGALLVIGVIATTLSPRQSVLGSDSPPASVPLTAGSLTAEAAYHSSINDARQEFWSQIARAFNDESGNFFWNAFMALQELDDGMDEANEQFMARSEVLDLIGTESYAPQIDASQFTAEVDNPFLPLPVGQIRIYEAMTADGLERIEVEVLADVQMINGVPCRAVCDTVTLDGEKVEETIDWYSQDAQGNVWYMGEIAMNFEDGFLEDLDGSWRFGKEGAQPGIIMPAQPMPGDAYRQEFLVNEAEDIAEILSTTASVTGPTGSYTNCVQTLDTTPLEPDVAEHKFYAAGVGVVSEIDLTNGETLVLVEIVNP